MTIIIANKENVRKNLITKKLNYHFLYAGSEQRSP